MDGDLVLKKLLCSSLEALLFNRPWYITFLENASWNENIIVDFVVGFRSKTLLLVRREQEAIEIILILPAKRVRGKVDRFVDIENGSLSNHRGLALRQIIQTI